MGNLVLILMQQDLESILVVTPTLLEAESTPIIFPVDLLK